MLDDEIGTHNSLVTIKFVCKPLGKGQMTPYPERLAEAVIRDANDEPYGYIDEYKLAPKTRQKRIDKALAEVDWYYLMLDLTPQALKDRMIQKYGKSEWDKLLQSEPCKVSMRKAGWHSGLFDDDK